MRNLNPSISEDLNRTFNLKGESTDIVSDFIQPTKEINPRINIALSSTRSTSGAGTIYTTPADKDFYLTILSYNYAKDAACDSVSGQSGITLFIDGVTRTLNATPFIVSTAQNIGVSHTFTPALKIDRNTAIAFSANTFTAGILQRSATLIGYTQETTKGV